jgi:hypothetical protein
MAAVRIAALAPDVILAVYAVNEWKGDTLILKILQIQMEDDTEALPGSLITGDWVAVKVLEELLKSSKGTAKAKNLLRIARVDGINDYAYYTVSFLRRLRDASYVLPEPEDVSTAEMSELVKLKGSLCLMPVLSSQKNLVLTAMILRTPEGCWMYPLQTFVNPLISAF